MARLLYIIVLFVVSLLVLKYVRMKIDEHTQNKHNQAKLNQSKQTGAKDMLKCQHCDLHIPKNEAIRQGDRVFCSLEHARKHLE
jgi:uncharacterized protein